MKIPSLSKLFKEASATFKRFPFVIIVSMLGAAFMIYAIQVEPKEQKDYQFLYNAVMCCFLGISFLLSLTLRNEMFKLERSKNYLAQSIGLLLLAAYYFWLPKDIGMVEIVRFILFGLGFHFLVSFTAFMNSDIDRQQNTYAFWRFNEFFFLRILLSALFSGVLYAGLSVAILSFNALFNAHINEKIYAQLFFFILGVFNTWFFLAGIPENLNEFYNESLYPKLLKIFTQFVLLPLVTIYLIILYMYMGKIIIQWNLPAGWVSYLILCFSIAGIFSLLLIYPIRNYEENRWIKVFSKSFYIALLPLIVLLFVAILTRLFAYGITERRYFVFVLACWLTFIALYFLISKAKNIKVIPITLCLLCFITSFGPWGAFAVSERSQVNRLEKILTANKILVDGKIAPAKEKLSNREVGNISSIIDFLAERHSMGTIQKWFDPSLDTIISKNKYAQSTDIMKLMGLKYKLFYKYDKEEGDENYTENFNYTIKEERAFKVKDYDYITKFSVYENFVNNNNDSLRIFKLDSNTIEVNISKPVELNVILNQKDVLKYDMQNILKNLDSAETFTAFPPEKGIIILEDNSMKLEVRISNISGKETNANKEVTSISGELLVKLKK